MGGTMADAKRTEYLGTDGPWAVFAVKLQPGETFCPCMNKGCPGDPCDCWCHEKERAGRDA